MYKKTIFVIIIIVALCCTYWLMFDKKSDVVIPAETTNLLLTAQDIEEKMVGTWENRPNDFLGMTIELKKDRTFFIEGISFGSNEGSEFADTPITFEQSGTWAIKKESDGDYLSLIFDENLIADTEVRDEDLIESFRSRGQTFVGEREILTLLSEEENITFFLNGTRVGRKGEI